MYPYVHCSIYNIYSQNLEAAQEPISRRVDKKALVHVYNGILLDHKKKEILPFVTAWIDLASIVLSEISQAEKEQYHIIPLICGM